MIFGLTPFVAFHTVISLVQLVAGIVVVLQLLGGRSSNGWTVLYLVSVAATCLTGFALPAPGFLPSHAVGILSLVLLLVVVLARYRFHLAGAWRWIYAVGIVITVYFDAFVTVVQTFLKVPAAHSLAPTGAEPPFAITQGIVLLIFVVFGIVAAIRFRPAATSYAAS